MELYIPVAFFACAFVLRFFDRSAKIYDEYFDYYDDINKRHVSLKRMKSDIKKEDIDNTLKKEIRKAILYRRLHYLFWILSFVSTLVMGSV